MHEIEQIDLFAEDAAELTAEVLDDAALLSTWGSLATFTSFGCPASSAACGGTASSAG
ncbi:thiocillin family RiPP [Streptomyces sp. NPDC057579]|uniref:thiocillin family RiPP n=1 Tax=Streptomyces sp. NPDC057579 TaxID=3346172 RepID=UPI0036B79C24